MFQIKKKLLLLFAIFHTQPYFTYHNGTLERSRRMTLSNLITVVKESIACGQDNTHLTLECEPMI